MPLSLGPRIPKAFRRRTWQQRRQRLVALINVLLLEAYVALYVYHASLVLVVFPFLAGLYALVEWCDAKDPQDPRNW